MGPQKFDLLHLLKQHSHLHITVRSPRSGYEMPPYILEKILQLHRLNNYMRDYLSNLLPRLVEFSGSLNTKEILIDQQAKYIDVRNGVISKIKRSQDAVGLGITIEILVLLLIAFLMIFFVNIDLI